MPIDLEAYRQDQQIRKAEQAAAAIYEARARDSLQRIITACRAADTSTGARVLETVCRALELAEMALDAKRGGSTE